jgi:hypothetical protein|tara:strand:- start:254 stop:466 length:213 start_codon:yes stop_codon:yes gene_type:complete
MAHLNLSGLMSWMKRGRLNADHRSQLLTWAKTEYGKDWSFAYDYMLNHEGRAPNRAELHGPRILKSKEVA